MIWRSRTAFGRRAILVTAATAGTAVLLYQAVVLSFVRYDDERYPYVYVHTSREIFALLDQIGRIRKNNPDVTIAITSENHFPLSWYLRDYHAGYYGRPVLTNDAIVIASEDQQIELDRTRGSQFAKLGPYQLRPGVRLLLYARRDLKGI